MKKVLRKYATKFKQQVIMVAGEMNNEQTAKCFGGKSNINRKNYIYFI